MPVSAQSSLKPRFSTQNELPFITPAAFIRNEQFELIEISRGYR
jgi:hypothetical protein